MARDDRVQPGDAGQFEWVNVWAAASGATSNAVTADEPAKNAPPEPAPAAAPIAAAHYFAAKSEPKGAKSDAKPAARVSTPAPIAPDQLMRDIMEIERVRDALAAVPVSGARTRAFMLVPSRASDSAPLLVGGVLALVMLTVFGAAAAMSKFGR